MPDDGSSMAWNAPVLSYNTGNVSGQYFYSTDFYTPSRVNLNGKGLSGDSGGPVFDSTGNLVGITVGQFGNLDVSGGTVAARLNLPEIQTWISANRKVVVPSLNLNKLGGSISVSWDFDAVGWKLQQSPDLSTWVDVGSNIDAPGSYSSPIDGPSRFFRLLKP